MFNHKSWRVMVRSYPGAVAVPVKDRFGSELTYDTEEGAQKEAERLRESRRTTYGAMQPHYFAVEE